MDLSLDSNYFINQIKSSQDKQLFIKYYENFQSHVLITKQYISIKKELLIYLKSFLDNPTHLLNLSESELCIYQQLYNELNHSITVIEDDAIQYKNNFKKYLFYLIKK